jgi:hypothetical protein
MSIPSQYKQSGVVSIRTGELIALDLPAHSLSYFVSEQLLPSDKHSYKALTSAFIQK